MSDVSSATQTTTDQTTQPPLANSQEARTTDGTLKDQSASATTSSTTTTQTESTADGSKGQTDSTKEAAKPAGAPAKYDLKATEGGPQLDASTVAEAEPIFRELGLDNAQAQRLTDFYTKQIMKLTSPEANRAILDAHNEKYITALKNDPEIGGKLDQVKADIGRAYDALGNSKLVDAFKAAMNESPEGNRPEFVKMIHAFAQKIIEGKHVSGSGPSPHGQTPGGTATRPTAAEAMYPNLVGNRPH